MSAIHAVGSAAEAANETPGTESRMLIARIPRALIGVGAAIGFGALIVLAFNLLLKQGLITLSDKAGSEYFVPHMSFITGASILFILSLTGFGIHLTTHPFKKRFNGHIIGWTTLAFALGSILALVLTQSVGDFDWGRMFAGLGFAFIAVAFIGSYPILMWLSSKTKKAK